MLRAQRGDPGPGGVDVHPGAVLAGEGGDGANRVDGAGAGGTDGRAHQHRAQSSGDVGVQLRGERVGRHGDRALRGVDDAQRAAAEPGHPRRLGH